MSEIVSLNALNLDESLTQFVKEVKDHSVVGFTHHQIVFGFPNGYGASVIRGDGSYGGRSGLFELGVLGKDGELTYTTPIADDVLGYLSAEDVVRTLHKIKALPESGVAIEVVPQSPDINVVLTACEVALIREAIAFFLDSSDDIVLDDHEAAATLKEKLGGAGE